MATRRLTIAQAIIAFLQRQYVEREGVESPFFAGCWGILGGNVAEWAGCSRLQRLSLLSDAQPAGDGISHRPPMKNHCKRLYMSSARRDQHGHRCGDGDQPPPRAPAAGDIFAERTRLCSSSGVGTRRYLGQHWLAGLARGIASPA